MEEVKSTGSVSSPAGTMLSPSSTPSDDNIIKCQTFGTVEVGQTCQVRISSGKVAGSIILTSAKPIKVTPTMRGIKLEELAENSVSIFSSSSSTSNFFFSSADVSKVYINGVEYVPAKSTDQALEKTSDKVPGREYKTSWVVQSETKGRGEINNVILHGAAQLTIDSDVPFQSSTTLSISGATRFELVSNSETRPKFDVLTVNASGTSVISLGGVHVDYTDVNSSGTSVVEDLVVSGTAQLDVSGVARIRYRLLNTSCRVESSSSGMGRIERGA